MFQVAFKVPETHARTFPAAVPMLADLCGSSTLTL